MKVKMITGGNILKKLPVVLMLTVLLTLGASCEGTSPEQFNSSETGVASSNEIVEDDPVSVSPSVPPESEALDSDMPFSEDAVQPESVSRSAFPEYTDEEYAAWLAQQFDKVHKVELSADSELYNYAIEAISDEEIVYSLDNHTASSSELFRYNFRTGETDKVVSLEEGTISSLHYSLEHIQLEISYWQGEKLRYKTWSPANGIVNDNPRIILAENPQWILYRSNEGPGIWASAREGSGEFKLTSYDLDNSPLWLPDTNQFVYVAHTGGKINDGSGYEYALSLYDMTARKSKELDFGRGQWIIRGWMEPGKKLLVDHAFNEGSNRNYAEPYLVDLKQMKEYRLLSEQMGAYDMQFNVNSASFVVAIPGYLAFYDRKGDIASLEPWFTDSSEQWAGSFKFSPDGKRGAYVMNFNSKEDIPISGGRLVITDALGRKAERMNDEFVQIADIEWSPEGNAIAALVQDKHGMFLVMERLKK
jgi:hypothetical protein